VSGQLVVSVWSVSVVSECVCVVSERSVCGQEWSVCSQRVISEWSLSGQCVVS